MPTFEIEVVRIVIREDLVKLTGLIKIEAIDEPAAMANLQEMIRDDELDDGTIEWHDELIECRAHEDIEVKATVVHEPEGE